MRIGHNFKSEGREGLGVGGMAGFLIAGFGIDSGHLRRGTQLVAKDVAFASQEIDDSAEVRLGANWQLISVGVGPEAVFNRPQGHIKISPDSIELVDETNAGDVVLVGLAPDSLR